MVAMEILIQRSSYNGAKSVRRKGTRQDTDIAKRTLQWLIQDVTDLIFEVLGRDEWVNEVFPALTQHGMNFTASSAKILIIIEGLPQCKERLRSRLSPSIEKDTHLRIEDSSKSIEKPSMRINLFAVLLLETENHLHRRQCYARRIFVARPDELLISGD